MFGRHLSDKQKKIVSKAHKGKIASLETRKKMSISHKGEKCHFWLGGKSFEPYGLEFDKELKELIRARNGYRCQECFKHESELFTKTGNPRKLMCHHINYIKTDNRPKNLISLCQKCHLKTNFKRKDWTKYFQKKILTLGGNKNEWR